MPEFDPSGHGDLRPEQLHDGPFYARHAALLEDLFSLRWLASRRALGHPGHRRWVLCGELALRNGVLIFGLDDERLREIAQLILDASVLTVITTGNDREFGSLDAIGDASVQRMVRSRITDPANYQDVMVELFVAAWHITAGRPATLLEIEGFPDIEIDHTGHRMLIECKRLWTLSNNRVGKIVTKANKQIKAAAKGEPDRPWSGHAVIQLQHVVDHRLGDNESPPPEAQAVIDEVQRQLRPGFNTSIRSAVVTWDQYTTEGAPPTPTGVWLSRQIRHIRHTGAPLGADPPYAIYDGETVSFFIRWRPNH